MDGHVVCDAGVWIPPRHRQSDTCRRMTRCFRTSPCGRTCSTARRTRKTPMTSSTCWRSEHCSRGACIASPAASANACPRAALLTRPALLSSTTAGRRRPGAARPRPRIPRPVRDELPVPTIYVTHHMQEVEAICERSWCWTRRIVVEQTVFYLSERSEDLWCVPQDDRLAVPPEIPSLRSG